MDPNSGENYLRVPEHERNFLISPPGSPPLGWIQVAEDGPNSGGCFDLNEALANFEASNLSQDLPEFKLDGATSFDGSLPTVVITNCDADRAAPSELLSANTSASNALGLAQRLAKENGELYGNLHLEFLSQGLVVSETETSSSLFVNSQNRLVSFGQGVCMKTKRPPVDGPPQT